jgi:uncharacterized membrane protein YgcG
VAKLVIEIEGTEAKRTAADLEAALKRLGIEAKTTEEKVKPLGKTAAVSLETAATAAKKFTDQLSGSNISLRGAEKAAAEAKIQIADLRREMEATAAKGGPIDPKAIARLKELDAQVDGGVKRLGNLKAIQDDVADATRTAAAQTAIENGQLTSLGGIASAVSPKMANLVGTIMSFAGAAAAGFYAGNQLRDGLNSLTDGGFDRGVQNLLHAMMPFNAALKEGAIDARTLATEASAAFIKLRNALAIRAGGVTFLETALGKKDEAEALASAAVAGFKELARESGTTKERMTAFFETVVDTEEALVRAGGKGSAEFNALSSAANKWADDIKNGEIALQRQEEATRKAAEEEKRRYEKLEAYQTKQMVYYTQLRVLAREAQADLLKPQPVDLSKLGITGDGLTNLERAKQLTAAMATESERHGVAILTAQYLLKENLITQETYQRVLEANRDTFGEIVAEADEWSAAIDQIQRDFATGMQSAFQGFFEQIFTTGKVGWKDLLDTIWKLFAQMLAKMLTEWIVVETKKTMETLRQNAIRGASNRSSDGGTSGGGSGIGVLSSLVGGGGSAAGGGSSFWGSMASYAVIAWAGYVIYKGFIENHDFKFAESSFGGFNSGIERWGRELSGAIETARKAIDDLAREMHLGSVDLSAASGIIIGRSEDNRYYVRGAAYSIARGFDTIQEAMEYAAVAALKVAEYGKEVSEFVRAAIRGSAADTLQGLREDIEFARRLESAGKPEFFADLVAAWNQFLDDWDRAVTLFRRSLDQLPTALNAVGLNLVTGLRDTYNQLTGHQPTRAEMMAEAQQRATLFNAQRNLTLAELRLRAMEIAQRIAMLQALAGIIGGGGDGVRPEPGQPPVRPDRGKSLLQVQLELWNLELQGKAAYLDAQGQLLKIEAEQRAALLATLQAQLDALNAIIGQIELIPEIKPEDIKLPRTGGRSRSDREREQLDLREQARMFGASDVKQQLYDAAHSLDDYIERVRKAGFSQAETARLIAAATAEERRRQDVIAAGIKQSADEFVRRGMSPATADLAGQFAGIDQEAGNLVSGLRALRQAHKITTAELIRRMQEIAAASDAMKRSIATQAFLDLAQRMAEAAGNQEAALKIEKLRWELEKANMKVQIEFLRASGLLTAANLALLDELYAGIAGLELPAGGAGGTNPYIGPHVIPTGGNQQTQEQIDAMRRLTSAIDKLREFNEGLLLSNQSPLTTAQKFGEAQREFARLAADAQSSNLATRTAAIEALPEMERTLLDLAGSMFGTAGAGYATIFDQIRALNALLTGGTFTPVSNVTSGNVINAQGSFGGTTATTGGGSAVTNVYMNTSSMEARLEAVKLAVVEVREEVSGLRYDVRRAGSLA